MFFISTCNPALSKPLALVLLILLFIPHPQWSLTSLLYSASLHHKHPQTAHACHFSALVSPSAIKVILLDGEDYPASFTYKCVPTSRSFLCWVNHGRERRLLVRVHYLLPPWCLWPSFPTTFKVSHHHQSHFPWTILSVMSLILATMFRVKDVVSYFPLSAFFFFNLIFIRG